jgi:prevent-host-death family protein
MKRIPISKFRAQCLAVLSRVNQTGRPVIVTRFGTPIAKVMPPSTVGRAERWLGSFRQTGRIVGDIVAPAASERA